MLRNFLPLVALVSSIALCHAQPAEGAIDEPQKAQKPDPKAIFGQAKETTRPTTLFNASVFGGTGKSEADGDINDSSGTDYYTGLQTTATHNRRSPRRTISASAGTVVRYFPQTRELITIDRSARVGIEMQLGGRNRVGLSQSVQHTPFRQFGQFFGNSSNIEGESPLANADGALAKGQSSFDLGTSVGLEHGFGRSSFSLGYVSRMNLSGSTDRLITHRGSVGLKLAIGRYMSLVIGTASRFGRTALTAPATRAQDIDLGIDFNRPLSFSRGTVVTITSGTALIQRTGTSADRLEGARQFKVIGGVAATQTLGRHWTARLGYDRNLQFVAIFPDPFYASGVSGQVTGQLTRRLNLRLQTDYSTGKAIEGETVALNKFFRGIQTQARLNIAVSRHWQFYAEHAYSESHLSAGALQSLPPGVVPQTYTRGVRFGLNLFAPRVH